MGLKMKFRKRKYIAMNPSGGGDHLVFNSKAQNFLFPSEAAAWKAIEEELDEPIAEHIAVSYPGRRKTYTLRDDGFKESDFKIFVSVEGK